MDYADIPIATFHWADVRMDVIAQDCGWADELDERPWGATPWSAGAESVFCTPSGIAAYGRDRAVLEQATL